MRLIYLELSELSSSMCCGERCYELDGDQKQLMALEVQTLDVIRPDNWFLYITAQRFCIFHTDKEEMRAPLCAWGNQTAHA